MTDREKLLKLRKLADAIYYAAQYLTTDASKLHKAMDEYHQFIIHEYHKEEPTIHDIVNEHWWEMLGEETVSEDLEKAADDYAVRVYNDYLTNPRSFEEKDADELNTEAFIAGAQWQKNQGVTKEAVIGMATEEILINVSQATLDELELCASDKVIIQLRKDDYEETTKD